MFGSLVQPSLRKLGRRAHAYERGSSSDTRNTFNCRAAAVHYSSGQTLHAAKVVDRRQVLTVLLASAALLLPSPPAMAEESLAEASPLPAAAAEVETLGQVVQISQSADFTSAPLAAPAPSQQASEVVLAPQPSTSGGSGSAVARGPTQVFMDITINGEPAGRITIELFADVPGGASRFAELAAGRQGVDYRLTKFNGVLPTYIRNDGLNRLSYSATEVSPISSGDSLDALEAELDRQTRRHDQSGLVSLIVRERDARPVKERLVARDGKFITVLEQAGEAPNGTQFTITTSASPELDQTNLIIGRLVEGDVLLKRIAALPVNKPRNDNPYFQAGKAMGDKRAVTAERAFYRPFQKVVVASSGVLS
ncbi:hypothetical protein Vretimale_4870 [Volvox reticuliferus]|uniref:PPIase cyclophilin-type domain-containing protein n=1 Tax=Volvox reticuliferus TaxID=1737510 RepID=A0A8J4DBQ3_9CHLO|nr:hypothetical protein Vretifemale_3497 [Volvox reticuliferus]GIL99730.1 hypothetical protein Vretimale_4870 [Volvox reticuliferus]